MLNIILVSFIAGVGGTGMGALCVIICGRPKEVFYHSLTGLAAGIMLAVTCLALIPESIAAGNRSLMINGFLGGIFIFLLIDKIVAHMHMSGTENGETSGKIIRIKKIGMLMAIGIAMHNFPEGLAIGAGYSGRTGLGISVAVLIGLHNIPEGLALATPIYASGVSKISTLIRTCLTGLPMVIGAFVGFLIGEVSEQAVSICLGFAAGAMFFITCDELIPECHMEAEKYGHIPILSIVIGFIIGLLIS